MVVGEATYEVFPPLFARVTLYPGGPGHPAVPIRVQGNEKAGGTLRRVTWNGRKLREPRISHRMLVQGGELVFHY